MSVENDESDDLSSIADMTSTDSGISLTPSTQSPSTQSTSPSPTPSSPSLDNEFDMSSTENYDNLFRAEDVGIDDSLDREDVCFFCGLTPEAAEVKGLELRRCQHCEEIYSCSEIHYQIHRPENKCFPFLIKKSEKSGRYMVASRDIEPCELILSEKPAVVGPYARTSPGCLQCFKKVDDSFLCPGCNFPMCNETCAAGPLHRDECHFFQESDFRPDMLLQQASQSIINVDVHSVLNRKLARNRASSNLVCITPLRMLLKKETDRKNFALINMLMDHEKEDGVRTRDKQINLQLVNAAIMLQEVSFKMDKFSQSDIQRMIGVLRTNGMKMEPHGDKGIPGVVIYPIYCLINHACYNNTNYVKFPDLHLELRSQLPIRKGEQIYTRYVSSTIGNLRRREDIRRYWYFDCKCRRCCDVTEFDTNMSGILCFSCKKGYLLPKDTLEYKSDWVCVNCQTSLNYDTIDEVLTAIEHQVRTCGSKRVRISLRVPPTPIASAGPWAEQLKEIINSLTESSNSKLVNLESCDSHVLEEMLFHFSKLLHPNHYILIDIMHNLVHVYAGKSILSRPEKERKIQLCISVLETLGRVDPGYTKWKGTLLQELIHPLMLISKEDHVTGAITPLEFQRRLAFCTKKLNEARRCLNDGFSPLERNPPTTEQRRIARSNLEKAVARRLERRAKQKI